MIELLLQAERALSIGLLDRAEALYRQVAAADPRNSIAVVGLSRVALDRGDEVGALELARRALTIDPENVAAQRMIARLEEVLEYRGQTVEPVVAAPVAVDSEPEPEPATAPEVEAAAPEPPSEPVAPEAEAAAPEVEAEAEPVAPEAEAAAPEPPTEPVAPEAEAAAPEAEAEADHATVPAAEAAAPEPEPEPEPEAEAAPEPPPTPSEPPPPVAPRRRSWLSRLFRRSR